MINIEKRRERQKLYQKNHYKKNTQYYKDKAKENKDLLRTKINEIKFSSECKECGESHIACLDFHHTEPEKKDFSISNAVSRGWKLDKILNEIEKCEILCANCHRKLHHNLNM